LLLGAEFAAARGRMHDPRGAWGLAPATPPGSRAMLASVLAASTVATDARRRPVSDPQPSSAVTPPTPRPSIATRLLAKHDAGIGKAVSIGKTVIKAETQATRAAAVTIVEAGRRAVAADRYVRRHPWESMLIAASTAMAVAALARRCNASNDAETPPSDNASR
ncbi:MAG: hypothetical protein ACN6QC_18245, partial [Paraburkholderia hospita]